MKRLFAIYFVFFAAVAVQAIEPEPKKASWTFTTPAIIYGLEPITSSARARRSPGNGRCDFYINSAMAANNLLALNVLAQNDELAAPRAPDAQKWRCALCPRRPQFPIEPRPVRG